MNRVKTTLFLGTLVGLCLAIGYLIGNTTGLIIGFLVGMGINFFSFWYSDKIVLKMHKAKEVPKTHPLYRMVDDLRKQMKLPMPKVYIIQAPSPNAFATGRSPKKGAVAATESLMAMLTEDELKGVMAHELSHIKHRDTLIQTIAVGIAASIAMIAEFMQWALIFGFGNDENGGGLGSIFGTILLLILTPIIATVIQLAISRQREFMADAGAVKVMKNPEPLINALQKLEGAAGRAHGKTTRAPTESLYIVNPFKRSTVAALFSTHPPTNKRVEAMRKVQY